MRCANVLQCVFAQDIGIALTGFGKLDDFGGDGLLDEVVAAFGPQGYAGHLERNSQDAPSLGVEMIVV